MARRADTGNSPSVVGVQIKGGARIKEESVAPFTPMKIVKELTLFENGTFPRTEAWEKAVQDVRDGISRVVWPPGSNGFTINPVFRASARALLELGWVEH